MFHFLHNRQVTVRSGADHKPVAFPGYLLFDGQGRVPKLVAAFPGRGLPAFADSSGAFLWSDDRKGRPALFYRETAAVWAGGLDPVMLRNGQSFRECFLAGVAEEFIVGHTNLPQSSKGCGWILDLGLEPVQLSPYKGKAGCG